MYFFDFSKPMRIPLLIALIGLLLLPVSGFSQSGPGGVGTITGTGTLKAWYKADAGVSYDGGNKVSNWRNSVEVSNLDIFASGSLMPAYEANNINGKPSISFGGANRLTTAFTWPAAR